MGIFVQTSQSFWKRHGGCQEIVHLIRRREEGVSEETVKIIEKCRKARLDGKTGLQKELRRRAKRAMRGDLESKIHGLC